MQKLLLLLCILLALTSCTPQASPPAEPPHSPTPTAAPTLIPTPTPAPTPEEALHEHLSSLAPQTLNMFRPFDPIEITPQQFMDEMAAIRALPFEERTDWFVKHGLCIPQPSEDQIYMDWQEETNLWSSLANYRDCVAEEIICGQKDGKMTHWQLIRSVSANSNRYIPCNYEVLFERTEGEPWKLIDILYRPYVWTGSHEEHTLLYMYTSNTFSLYDPAQRGILLTVPAGELDLETDGMVTRYVYDEWDWIAGDPLSALADNQYAHISILYERYPAGEMELDKRVEYGGYAMIYTMENHRPSSVKTVLVPNPDRQAFETVSSADLMRSDYVCPAYSELRGDMVTQTDVCMTETRRITIERVHERATPLTRSWKDNELNCTRLLIYDGKTLLQTIEIDDLTHSLPEEEAASYEIHRLKDMWYDDRNGDGFPDLEAEYGYSGKAYFFLWDPAKEQYVFEGIDRSTQILP